jgi:hypothetical protein
LEKNPVQNPAVKKKFEAVLARYKREETTLRSRP